jgi:hypothetical protein
MEILIIHHNYKYLKFPYSWVEGRLIDSKGNYIKISLDKELNESAVFRRLCPKDKEGNFIQTHIIRFNTI